MEHELTEQATTDPRRDTFLRMLRPRNSLIADIYEAGRFLIDIDIPARSVLLAHTVRELRNRLPDAFGAPRRSHLQYHERLEEMRPLWLPVADRLPGPSSMEEEINVPLIAAQSIHRLFEDDADVEQHIKLRFLHMCAAASGEAIQWRGNERLAAQWAAINVEGIAHSGSTNEADNKALAAFNALDEIILGLFAHAPERERDLKALASAATASTVLDHLFRVFTLHDLDVYFGSLNEPAVFDTLKNAGQFDINGLTLNYWPQGAYLRNIVTDLPEDISVLVRNLPETTPGITRQLLDITMRLPDGPFVKVMRKGKWLLCQTAMEFVAPLLRALARLADLGEEGALFRIAAVLFRIDVEPSTPALSWRNREQAVPAMESHSFETILETAPVTLARVSPFRTLDLLKTTLDRVITIEGYDSYEHHGFWYNNLLDDEARRYDLKTQLTASLRDLAMETAKKSFSDVIYYFDSTDRNRSLYRRVADAVTVRYGTPEQAAARIAYIEQWRYGEEHRALLERGYTALPAETQAALIEATYDQQRRVIARALAEHGRDGSEVDSLLDGAVARIFGPAGALTPEPYRSRLVAALQSKEEELPVHALDIEEMERLGISAVGTALDELVLDPESGNGRPWSIGGALRVFVEQHGAEWLESPLSFSAIPAYYLGWALNGLEGYRRGHPDFDQRVVELLDGALNKASAAAAGDSSQQEVARHIAQNSGSVLAQEARKATTNEAVGMLLQCAEKLRTINVAGTEKMRSPWSAPHDAISDSAALAVHIVGTLILAVHNHNLEPSGVKNAYDKMSHSDNLAVRAELGHFFSWFTTKFSDAAPGWAQTIFLGENQDANRAAWAGFVTFSTPNRSTFRLLRSVYHERLDDLASGLDRADEEESNNKKIVREQTLWHIWILLANNVELIDNEGSLAHRVIRVVADRDLEHLVSEVGSSLQREGGDDQDRRVTTFEQAMLLWKRVEELVEKGKRDAEVLSGLPHWINSPLPAEWRFARAEALSGASNLMRRDAWLIVKAVVGLGDIDRLRALKVLEVILTPVRMDVLTAVQQFAGALINAAVTGSTEEEHRARRINDLLVNNHRPSLLED